MPDFATDLTNLSALDIYLPPAFHISYRQGPQLRKEAETQTAQP
jgi:hypothetical protein